MSRQQPNAHSLVEFSAVSFCTVPLPNAERNFKNIKNNSLIWQPFTNFSSGSATKNTEEHSISVFGLELRLSDVKQESELPQLTPFLWAVEAPGGTCWCRMPTAGSFILSPQSRVHMKTYRFFKGSLFLERITRYFVRYFSKYLLHSCNILTLRKNLSPSEAHCICCNLALGKLQSRDRELYTTASLHN